MVAIPSSCESKLLNLQLDEPARRDRRALLGASVVANVFDTTAILDVAEGVFARLKEVLKVDLSDKDLFALLFTLFVGYLLVAFILRSFPMIVGWRDAHTKGFP